MAQDNGYPIVVMQDRYRGVYSGGAWLAIAEASECVDGTTTRAQFCLIGQNGPSDSDVEAGVFWNDPPDWVAVGRSPDGAIAALLQKVSAPETQSQTMQPEI